MIALPLGITGNRRLTILSFGGGQDSTALLYKYIYDLNFRALYAPEDFIVIMSDTGDEHKETYEHVAEIKTLCAAHGIEFHHITKDLGYHGTWGDLRSFYNRTITVGSKCFRKTCTDNLKLKPIHRYLETYLTGRYDLSAHCAYPKGRKRAFKEFVSKHGRVTMMVGIAAGEEKRVGDPEKRQKWERESIDVIYPLIDMKMDRAACIEYIASTGHKVPQPSNCILCPFLSEVELLYMDRFLNADLQEWIRIEANKIERFKDRDGENLGVWGKVLLPEKLEEVRAKHGHMSNDELVDYKMSHGHCVASKY